MGIESPRIVVGPTISRENVYVNCVPLYNAVPLDLVVVKRWNTSALTWEFVTLTEAEITGLIAVVTPNSLIAELYMGVNKSWVRVNINSEPIDPGTGAKWDPLAQFYTPLAS